jgi:hypothetical protein
VMEAKTHDLNRRAHRRVPSSELPDETVIRIPQRPAISLIDLSPGGALLDLPFQMHPESRITLELFTSAERLAVPFQLLRCYVADLTDGVRYHAAGVFDQTLTLPTAVAAGVAASASDRLVATLESFLRNSQTKGQDSRGFDDLLSWVLNDLRKGDPANLISIQIKARLSRLFPSIAIFPASPTLVRETATSARFFGFEFRSAKALTAAERRFLRASAQLLALIERNAEPQATENLDSTSMPEEVPAGLIVHSLAEWQGLTRAAR